MKKYICAILISTLIFSCNKKTDPVNKVSKEIDSSDLSENESFVDTLGAKSYCYLGVSGKDSVFVNFDDNLGTIMGKMAYKNHEKDSSKGDLSGFSSGDTLKLTYEFDAEGTKSKRDIFFIRKGKKLIEGLGDQLDENGSTRYVNENKLSYDNGLELSSANCNLVSKALQ